RHRGARAPGWAGLRAWGSGRWSWCSRPWPARFCVVVDLPSFGVPGEWVVLSTPGGSAHRGEGPVRVVDDVAVRGVGDHDALVDLLVAGLDVHRDGAREELVAGVVRGHAVVEGAPERADGGEGGAGDLRGA